VRRAAIPELVAWGSDWLITPLAPGAPLDWGGAVPAGLFDALAALHARYRDAMDRSTPGLPWTAGHRPPATSRPRWNGSSKPSAISAPRQPGPERQDPRRCPVCPGCGPKGN
jgi:hypothetical protein